MSLVSSFGTAGRTTGESYRNGTGRVTGSSWGKGTATMSVQYRPDLGSISLNPQFSPDSASLKPFSLDVAMSQASNFSPLAFNRTNNPSAPSPVDLTDPSLLPTKLSLLEAQRQMIFRAMKLKNFGSPLSPLSPQESVNFSDPTFLPPGSTDSCRLRLSDGGVQNQTPLYNDSSYRFPPTSFPRDVHFSDLPIVRGPAAFQNPSSSSSESRAHNNNDNVQNFKMGDSPTHFHGESQGNEQAKRFKRTLEELERELLSDDGDLPSSTFHGGQTERSFTVDPAERDWADVIEDLLSESSSLSPQASDILTVGEQPVFSCSSRISNSQSKGQGSLASEVTSQANATVQRSPFSQQQNPAGQPQGSEVTSVTALRSPFSQQQTRTSQPLQSNPDTIGQPKQLLISCAAAIVENDFELASNTVASLKQVASIYGDPMQRLAAYMTDALVTRLESSDRCLSKPSKCKDSRASWVLPAMQVLYEACPYYKFGYMAANGAIAEAFKDEQKVHIIDFEIGQGSQWMVLIGAFAARPGGPPKVRITGVDDPQSNAGPAGGLQSVGNLLGKLAQSVGVPFEFHSVAKKVSEVEPWMLEKRPGEALAVNFTFQLHHMPDESVCTTNPRDRLLRMVRVMDPKVVTLVEFEANTNTAPFYPRFLEALSYYTALFESLDASLPRESRDRVNVEQNCLAKDIVNIISCEGSERVQRYELAGKWRARMTMAGFRPYPLSSFINSTINSLLKTYSINYRLREEGGALHLGWLDRDLIVASAWQ